MPYEAGSASLPTISAHNFGRIPKPAIRRSSFLAPFRHKTTGFAGDLIPIFCEEVLPGDTWNCKATALLRLSTPIYPIMDNMYCDLHWFYFPERICWENWKKFQGERLNPDSSVDYTTPRLLHSSATPTADMNFTRHSIYDYLRLPVGVNIPDEQHIRTAKMRGYGLIFNDWYRSQDYQDSVVVPLDDGPDYVDEFTLKKRNRKHDYFTSLLPLPQKGTAVALTFAADAQAPVIGTGRAIGLDTTGTGGYKALLQVKEGVPTYRYLGHGPSDTGYNAGDSVTPNNGASSGIAVGLTTNPDESGMIADLSSVSLVDLTEIREAIVRQQILELDSRGGTRYREIIETRWGVDIRDDRLQRPEFLGGSSAAINISAVPQTSESSGTTPQGNLAAFGVGINHGGFVKTFPEHGFVMCILSTRADTTYQQGLHRSWSRETRLDFYEPLMDNLTEQAVLNKEFAFIGNGDEDLVMGYQERWGEYRTFISGVSGMFRSIDALSLDPWHLAIDPAAATLTMEDLLPEVPPMARILAVPLLGVDPDVPAPDFLIDFYGKFILSRPMSMYGVPGLDRF